MYDIILNQFLYNVVNISLTILSLNGQCSLIDDFLEICDLLIVYSTKHQFVLKCSRLRDIMILSLPSFPLAVVLSIQNVVSSADVCVTIGGEEKKPVAAEVQGVSPIVVIGKV